MRESHERILSGKGTPADLINILGDPTQSVSLGVASAPHAAAEPEKPMDKARREWIRDLRAYASGSGGTRIDSGECVELAELLETPLYASPAVPKGQMNDAEKALCDSIMDEHFLPRATVTQTRMAVRTAYVAGKAAVQQPIAREPTQAMLDAAVDYVYYNPPHDIAGLWKAMYDAALKSAEGEK